MIRRLVCLLIITSMILHCASRLGLLSYLHKNRHDIAYAVGLIAEVPIAICSGDYHFSHELLIQDTDDDSLPFTVTQTQEIILFSPSAIFSFLATKVLLENEVQSVCNSVYRSPAGGDIFHPPSIG